MPENIAIIVPIYNEAGNIAVLVQRLDTVSESLKNQYGMVTSYTFIDDGSTDDGFSILRAHDYGSRSVSLLQFSRNFGKEAALTAGIAKENLRNLLTLARTGADRHQVGQARWQFLTWCADSDIPEVRQLAVTVDRWWPEVRAFIDTGHTNAKSEGINRVIKLVTRNAFGFRNAENQRLLTRCVTTRRARGHLRTAQL